MSTTKLDENWEYRKYMVDTQRFLFDNDTPGTAEPFTELELAKAERDRRTYMAAQKEAALESEIKRLNEVVNTQKLRSKEANNEGAYAINGIKIISNALEFLDKYPAVAVAGGIALAVAILS